MNLLGDFVGQDLCDSESGSDPQTPSLTMTVATSPRAPGFSLGFDIVMSLHNSNDL